MKEKAKPVVKTEEQFLYLCHLVGPFLQRLNAERPRCMLGLTVELYELLEQVDKSVTHLKYMDPICDLLYPLLKRITLRAISNKIFNVGNVVNVKYLRIEWPLATYVVHYKT